MQQSSINTGPSPLQLVFFTHSLGNYLNYFQSFVLTAVTRASFPRFIPLGFGPVDAVEHLLPLLSQYHLNI